MAQETIRILIATDNHVGYNERDPIRGDDSWTTFHEILCLAKERDVDMVLLAGDLFHENKPSRKAMYQVMRSLRMNCYGDKPCELEMLSDASENFEGAFNHVNYEDQDINVAIPVFSIHGNHDDPSGEGHLAALDLLQISGLVNYYGRTPESDNIHVKPVLLQKGQTKLALYGMSNVRDERLFRTFRDGKVKFYQPATQKSDWFNILSVHQNHYAHTETNYLPENFLPDFLDLVVWGHEHECLIDPRINPETNFKVMQPGSSVATSLVPGEAEPKHIAILSITGRQLSMEKIRLKTVRPFAMREMALGEEKEAQKFARKDNNRTDVSRYLIKCVEQLIEQAKAEWLEAQDISDTGENDVGSVPLPLIRLRVEISAPDGGAFDCENPQRFSNRFVGKVANVNDVVQFHRRKKNAARNGPKEAINQASGSRLQGLDTVAVEKLVREYLAAQSLTILPQNYFGDAVTQYIDKDDKHAMEMFVNESLSNQTKHLLSLDRDDDGDDQDQEDRLAAAMEEYRAQLEEMFSRGRVKRTAGGDYRFKPKPDSWDDDFDGVWEDQPGALLRSDEDDAMGNTNGGANLEDREDNDNDAEEDEAAPVRPTAARGRSRGGRSRGASASRAAKSKTTTTRRAAAVTQRASGLNRTTRTAARRNSDDDIAMDDIDIDIDEENEDEEDSSQALFVKNRPSRAQETKANPATAKARRGTGSQLPRNGAAVAAPHPPAIRKQASRSINPTTRQSKINFSASQASVMLEDDVSGSQGQTRKSTRNDKHERDAEETIDDDDDDDDDDDAFEPMPKTRSRR